MAMSSDHLKRTTSLLQSEPEKLVDIHESWKYKFNVPDSIASLDTYKRIYVPASNINRAAEDGCMKKILIERSMKLRREDLRTKNTNVITNNMEEEKTW
mgnify:CR=1 FL=1